RRAHRARRLRTGGLPAARRLRREGDRRVVPAVPPLGRGRVRRAAGGGPVSAAAPEHAGDRGRQELLSRAALGVFRLNGQFLQLAEELARPAGLTAARWQVLGAVLGEPLPVAGIARVMGIT